MRSIALVWLGVMVLFAGLAAVYFHHRQFERTTIGRTVAWMEEGRCASVSRHRRHLPLTPVAQAGEHADFDDQAREYVRLDCEHFGGYVVYERFPSLDALEHALGASRGIRRTNLCTLGPEVLSTRLFAENASTGTLCRALRGRLRRP